MPKRSRIGSWRPSSSWTVSAHSASTPRRPRPNTWVKRDSTKRVALRSHRWSRSSTAISLARYLATSGSINLSASPRRSWRHGGMSYRLEIGLSLLLASAIAVAMWAANRAPHTPPFDMRASTYLSGPDGSKGLYEVLRSLGRPTERRRTPLFTLAEDGAHRPAILRLSYRGGGTITLVADPGWFTNRTWRNTDVPIVALPLLTPRPERPGRVAWDEYHQGFRDTEGMSLAGHTWSWLRGSSIGWAVLQLVAVALIWLSLTAVRFGPARSVIERRRRSPLEHLEALGAGLESAADTDTATKCLILGLRRRLSRAGYAGDGNVLPWLESLELAMRGPQGRSAVRRLY